MLILAAAGKIKTRTTGTCFLPHRHCLKETKRLFVQDYWPVQIATTFRLPCLLTD